MLDTDLTSAKFWNTEPTGYHSFDSLFDIDVASVAPSVAPSEDELDEVDTLSDDMEDLDMTEEQKAYWAKSRGKSSNSEPITYRGGYQQIRQAIRDEFLDESEAESETTPTTSKVI